MSEKRTVCKKDMCAGCMACIEKCPKDAIKIEDSLLAYNAIIDTEKCIDCSACHKVCQSNYPAPLMSPIQWKQGWSKQMNIRSQSSSGGIAAAIEKAFVRDGGIVCSCTFSNGNFCFEFAEAEEEIQKFVGSKYVKSNPIGIYKIIQKTLKSKKVLFVGLPCQVSAVRNFVGESLSQNLYTVDLICHGSPSPKVLDMYLKQHDVDLERSSDISFREKTKFQLILNKHHIGVPGTLDRYSISFLNMLIYTENCYQCPYARKERVSDISLGDSWGSELPEEEKKKGISLVLCQNEKGKELLNRSGLHLEDVNIEKAIAFNHQLSFPSEKPDGRDYFFKKLQYNGDFDRIVQKLYPKNCFKQNVKRVLIMLGFLRGIY